jgi:hypothetical protein
MVTPEWKLSVQKHGCTEAGVRQADPMRGQCEVLYHLAADPSESTDLFAAEPERATQMEAALLAWAAPRLPDHAPDLPPGMVHTLQRFGYWNVPGQPSDQP